MKDSLVARGVPANVIILDGKGLRTLDSIVRCVNLFKIKSFTVISQRFHNERALFLARNLCLNVGNLHAFNAKDAVSEMAFLTYIREYFARVKMFLDISKNRMSARTAS